MVKIWAPVKRIDVEAFVALMFIALVVGTAALVIGWDMLGQPTPKRIYRKWKRRRRRGA